MRKLSFLLCTLLCTLAFAQSWPVAKLRQSVTPIYGNGPENNVFCTAAAISPTKLLTASHCVLLVGGLDEWYTELVDIRLVEVDKSLDGLAVFESDVPHELKPLSLGKEPQLGDEVLLMGYGGQAPEAFALPGIVWSTTMLQPATNTGPFLWVSRIATEGMSGGPVVDRKGKLVSVVIGGFDKMTIGYNSPYQAVADKFKRHGK